jgi:hypothetical protein
MKKLKSDEEIRKEILKCKNDIVYFVENYVSPKIKLSDFDKAILKAYQNNQKVIMVSGRRCSRYLATFAQRHDEFKKEQS